MGRAFYKIGDLAQRSGVTIKTIRHYSDIGVLPPTATTEAGFRLYSDSDLARLELIRTLREANFSLVTIKQLLRNEISSTSALESQLAVVEENLGQLRRQRAVIRAALHCNEDDALGYLSQARTLAKLDAGGRVNFLDEHLHRIWQDAPGDLVGQERIWQEAVLGHNEELDSGQLEAWMELTHLLLDQSFARRFNKLIKKYWTDRRDYFAIEGWRQHEDGVVVSATKMARRGKTPYDPGSQTLVQCFIDVSAALMGRKHDPTLPDELLHLIEEGMDSRLNQFWKLTGVLKGWSASETWSFYQGHCWLYEGLRFWIGSRPRQAVH